MPKKKPENRIESLKAFIFDQEMRLDSIKSVQTIRAKIEAARTEKESLEASEAQRKKEAELEAAKIAADRKRKDDQRAKILWGAGLQLLDPTEAAGTRAKICKVLNDRDQKWIMEYITKHKIAVSDQKVVAMVLRAKDVPPPASEQVDPVAMALIRVLELFDPMARSHIEGEFLNHSQGEDRRVLEVYFAQLGKRRTDKSPD